MSEVSQKRVQVGSRTIEHPFLKFRLVIVGSLFLCGVLFLLSPFSFPFLAAASANFGATGFVLSVPVLLALPLLPVYYGYRTSKQQYIDQTESIPSADAPELYEFLEAECERLDIPVPDLRYHSSGAVNAFAFGRRQDGYIVLMDGLLAELDDDAIEAVVAHELAHIYHRDSVLLTVIIGVRSLIVRLLVGVGYPLKVGLYERRGAVLSPREQQVVKHNIYRRSRLLTAPLGLYKLAISRYREYIADAEAAEMTSPQQMTGALQLISETNTDDQSHEMPTALCIFSEHSGFLSRIRSDHPPISKRIDRIETLYD